MITFRSFLESGQPLLFDGSLVTLLYEKGIFINRSFEEANLVQPELVLEAHRENAKAGAMVLTANTWAANRPKLAAFGLESRLADINRAGVHLARQAAQHGCEPCWVAACLGPLGLRIEPWGPTSFEEARTLFRAQAQAQLDAGVDLFILESFADLNEMHQAILAVRELTDLPLVTTMTPNEEGQTLFGTEPDWYIHQMEQWGADLLGVNGGSGPASTLELLKRLKTATTKPILLQPSAGLPRLVEGRLLYMASPEYLGEFARKALQAGARAVGGDSGTTPAHIRSMAMALRQERAFVQGAASSHSVQIRSSEAPRVAMEDKSQVARKLVHGEHVISVELVPPKSLDASRFIRLARECRELGVDAINIPDGPRAMARMSALAAALILEREVGIETILHYTCRDRNMIGIQSDLLGAAGLGLKNILALTGDPPKLGPYPFATAVFDVDAIGLVNILSRLNSGLDLGGTPIGEPTRFSVGVAANPMAIDLDRERQRFFYKVEAGAEWAMTQPVFEAESFFRFQDSVQHHSLPFIAGIWPLRSLRNAEFMAHEVPGVYVPLSILERMASGRTSEEQLQIGLQIAQELVEALRPRVQGFQFSLPSGDPRHLRSLMVH